MAKAKLGDRLRVHFVGRLDDGTVFESSEDAGEECYSNFRGKGVEFAPIELVLGEGEQLRGFEDALLGLEPGQSTTTRIAAAEAYGTWRSDRVVVVAREDLARRDAVEEDFLLPRGRRPGSLDPKPGDVLEVSLGGADPVEARVLDVGDNTVTLDTNHPLAGKDVTFEIRLVEIV